MRRPLVWLTVFFCLGIFLASLIKANLLLIWLVAAIFLVFSLLSMGKGLSFEIFLFCLAFLLGAGLFTNHKLLPKCHISKFISYPSDNFYKVKGYIASGPTLKTSRTFFIFRTQEIQFDNLKYNCCGDIIVYIKGKKDLHYGEALILIGNLYWPFKDRVHKRRSYRDYLYNQGIWAIMNVKFESQITRLNKNNGFILKRLALWLKAKMEELVFKRLSLVSASILDAMVLGEKCHIPPFIYNSMVKSGTVHILVVSGFNVGIVTFIITLFLKLVRISRRARFYIASYLLIIYCFMTGASNPVVRATVMAIMFMFGLWLKREPDIYNSCALSALFILMINPRQLFDIGFQLSFVSVLSIVYLYPKTKSFLRLENLKVKFVKFLITGFLVSLSAWLGTMGFIAYYFKIFSPITVIANIFIVPLASLITLCGFSLIITGLIYPPFTPLFVSSTELVSALLLNINAFLIKLPGAYFYLP